MSTAILITGASSGFGRAAAETLARRGYMVFATMRDTLGRNARNREALDSLTLRERLALETLDMDVNDDNSVDQRSVRRSTGPDTLNVIINNAGFTNIGITEAYTVDQVKQIFDTNVLGAVRVNRAVLPGMRSQRSGLLIHVSSAAGRVVVPFLGPYCASKFALEAIADAYRYELAPFNVDSVLVEPGIHRTPIFDKISTPADAARVDDYGDAAEYATRVSGVFQAGIRAPDALETKEVVDCFIRLIETPYGERPFRTVPTPAIQPLLEAYNARARQNCGQLLPRSSTCLS
jgi:NADP-dependent 3-hydroxy acid dehydrogenase YdfG